MRELWGMWGPARFPGEEEVLAPGVLPWLAAWVSVLAAAACVAGGLVVWWRDLGARRRVWTVLGTLSPGPCGSTEGGDRTPGPGDAGTAAGEHWPLLSRGGPGWLRSGRRWLRSRTARDGAGAVGAGVLGVVLVGGAWGWFVGAVAAFGVRRWLQGRADRDGGEGAAEERKAEAQLPLTAELMAACLAAGSGPGQAAEAVGHSVSGPLGARLVRAATELRLGGEPAVVWGRFGAHRWSAGFARCMERAGAAGVPAVEPVTRLAAELRGQRSRAAIARARRAGVLVTGPLGLCFLPAFLVIGVAPVVLGLARSLW
ncbi:type II secretion system F family protein [Streptomyces iconiensis]|uniref:Type II secretion system F family protein n=1 Tax=Streptomyces iconiensis TaxID=1384038 RepID=A0ABT6ZS56_9ACTN|nr:type II secretion system F family protein [Streptomyces iconiensis]MDJ1131902.1 type II secretion system F family protein [Streptomyces iconiensis]